jgi:type III restriction enzyme
VANESQAQVKKWKEFLLSPVFGFRYIVGVSGTCYVGDDYFSDVIYRYALRQAMEERYVKKVTYVAEVPASSVPDAKWQLIYNRHIETRDKLRSHRLLPLTIVVTRTITTCKDVAEELKGFLREHAGLTREEAEAQVLVVYNNAPDVSKLPYVDAPTSKVEWILAVSMLNEGWDVKRVFQIVPHEQRAFNSKLLIAQVLGRGLRVPEGWTGAHPEVTVFNHEAWASGIRHLVDEILETEKRLSSRIVEDSLYHFDLWNIDYTMEPTSIEKPMSGPYTLFEKGYVDLASQSPTEQVKVVFERAGDQSTYNWQTEIRHVTYTPRQVAQVMYERLQEADDAAADESDPAMRTTYTTEFPVEKLEEIVQKSLEQCGATQVTETMRQKFLQSLGTLRRKATKIVRYTAKVNCHYSISTRERQADSVSAAELHRTKTIFYTPQTRATLENGQVEFFDEVDYTGSGYKHVEVKNYYEFKTPLNAIIADSENERRFIEALLNLVNLESYDAWIKSTAVRFYEIDYAWKKGEHPKTGKFSPDFFIKAGNLILVVEIKDDEEIRELSEENRKKNEYAMAHFERINQHLQAKDSPLRYYFHLLTPSSFGTFFDHLRDGRIPAFRSDLDVALVSRDEDAMGD